MAATQPPVRNHFHSVWTRRADDPVAGKRGVRIVVSGASDGVFIQWVPHV